MALGLSNTYLWGLDVSVGTDQTWTEQLSLAEVVANTQTTEANFLIPLGKNQKVDGRWQLEHSQPYNGVIYRSLYGFQSGINLAKMVQLFEQFLQQEAADVKYECRSRSCGSSNFWANDYFSERLLFGDPKNQHLWVYQAGKHWFVAYLMQRGNGRIYFQKLKMGLEGSTPHTFSLGRHCTVSKKNTELFEFIQGATIITNGSKANASVPTVRLVLTVSAASNNAWQDAQTFASACAMRIQKTFNVALYDSLGLGDLNFRLSHRVADTEYTLHRFSP